VGDLGRKSGEYVMEQQRRVGEEQTSERESAKIMTLINSSSR
jgi:hypothetical protein